MRDLAAEELGLVERGLVDEHRNALCLDALHDALDRGRAEVVASRLHGEAVDADDRFLDAFVHECHDAFDVALVEEVAVGDGQRAC